MKQPPNNYVPPQTCLRAFHCPLCGVYAEQRWKVPQAWNVVDPRFGANAKPAVTLCIHCNEESLWHNGSLLYPRASTAPMPLPDTPDDIRQDIEEARDVYPTSARASAALMRLALQKLMPHLGESGKNINDDIAALVKKGLPVTIQKALDSVRVIGNNAVHAGQIDLQDSPETALSLFRLFNFIVEKMVTEPKQVTTIYDALPTNAKDAIAKRDGKP
jgi:hypothetical protein